MGAALADGGKTLLESDPEVSEAVDFVEFYSQTAVYFDQLDGCTARAGESVVVVSPWNFPIAIPCGGVAAALAAGNTVILKPASDTVLVAHELCQCFWRAGISQKTLQLVPCSGRVAGEHLITHPEVDTVILTGGTDTALQMLAADTTCGCWPKRAARTPPSSPPWPIEIRPSRTSSTPLSVTRDRSVRPHRC